MRRTRYPAYGSGLSLLLYDKLSTLAPKEDLIVLSKKVEELQEQNKSLKGHIVGMTRLEHVMMEGKMEHLRTPQTIHNMSKSFKNVQHRWQNLHQQSSSVRQGLLVHRSSSDDTDIHYVMSWIRSLRDMGCVMGTQRISMVGATEMDLFGEMVRTEVERNNSIFFCPRDLFLTLICRLLRSISYGTVANPKNIYGACHTINLFIKFHLEDKSCIWSSWVI